MTQKRFRILTYLICFALCCCAKAKEDIEGIQAIEAEVDALISPSKDSFGGFYLFLSQGGGEISASTLKTTPPTLDLGLGLGYDFILSFIGLGVGSSLRYSYQMKDGADVGGTYSGWHFNLIQPRLSLLLGPVTLSYEHFVLSRFEVNKRTTQDQIIRWMNPSGFEASLSVPLHPIGAQLALYYSHTEYVKEALSSTELSLSEPVTLNSYGLKLLY